MITKETTWTEEVIERLLADILKIVNDNQDVLTLQSAIEQLPEYVNRQYISLYSKKYSDNVKIHDTYQQIKNILENRINIGGMGGELNANMVKFNLMNNYKWSERQETESKNLNYNVNNEKDIQDKTAEDISRDYTELLRGAQKGE